MEACVLNRLNIIVSGGTGSGKTTLLNVLSGFIPDGERIVTIEDVAELQLSQDHKVRLETKPPSLEGGGAVSIRDLVINALRMRPDRIVVGECRGGEALDMMQAMNTGHDGSLTTLHANNTRDALRRLEVLCLMALDAPPHAAIRDLISSAINIIVQIQRFTRDGSRRITAIDEVSGIQGDVIGLTPVFQFKQRGFDAKTGRVLGERKASGLPLKCVETWKENGIYFDNSIFTN